LVAVALAFLSVIPFRKSASSFVSALAVALAFLSVIPPGNLLLLLLLPLPLPLPFFLSFPLGICFFFCFCPCRCPCLSFCPSPWQSASSFASALAVALAFLSVIPPGNLLLLLLLPLPCSYGLAGGFSPLKTASSLSWALALDLFLTPAKRSPSPSAQNVSSPPTPRKSPKPLSTLAIYISKTWHSYPLQSLKMQVAQKPARQLLPLAGTNSFERDTLPATLLKAPLWSGVSSSRGDTFAPNRPAWTTLRAKYDLGGWGGASRPRSRQRTSPNQQSG